MIGRYRPSGKRPTTALTVGRFLIESRRTCCTEVTTMIAFKYFGNNDARRVDVPRPSPGPGEVLVRVLATGVCGTDLHVHTHGDWIGKAVAPGVTMGHEFVGAVVDIGPDVVFAQKYPQVRAAVGVGTRVCAEPHIPCGTCY
jgi:threonine dehydrogenase-like Zn-dependent dehydrogenase